MKENQNLTWNSASESLPSIGDEVEITHHTFIGTRRARMEFDGWFFTDCVHPLQQAYVPFKGSGWRAIHDKFPPRMVSGERPERGDVPS